MKYYANNFKHWIYSYKIPLIHIMAWAVFFLLPYIFSNFDYSEPKGHSYKKNEFLYVNLITNFLWVAVFYFNTQVLIPKLLYAQKYILYLLFQIGLFCLIMLNGKLFFLILNINTPFVFLKASSHNITPFLFISLASIVFKLIWDKRQVEERQKENTKTELSFLRSQISPHFLFNVLNNIVAMVRLKSDELEDTVVKLSTLLQYMLYETDEEKVLLRNEIEYLESYIDLQSQRFGNKIQINKTIEVKDNYQTIEPMLLIPFVENAFKHGYGLIKNPVIDISLKTENNILLFEVKNKFNKADNQKDKTSGIGLVNVKRRLELLYADQYQLDINQEEGWFDVKLKLILKP